MDLNEAIREFYSGRFSDPGHEGFFESSGFSNLGYWLESTELGKDAAANLVDKLLEYVPEKRGSILDVACGQGGTTARLLNHYEPSNVTAINLAENQLREAEKRAPGCNFILMDAAELDFCSASFDTIICVEAACHFRTREKFLGSALEILKPGGRLIMSDLIFGKHYRYLPDIMTGPKLMPPENHWRSMKEYRRVCEDVGFVDVVVDDVTSQTWKAFRRKWTKFHIQEHSGSRRNLIRERVGLALWYIGWSYLIRDYFLISAGKPA